MQYKKLLTCCAILALSAVGFADGEKCAPGKSCGGKVMGPTGSGDRPLSVEPQDSCKGTVKCINKSRYPDGTKSEMIVDTKEGEQKVIMQGQPAIQPGDRVEVTGRNVDANGNQMMIADEVKRSGTSSSLNNEAAH